MATQSVKDILNTEIPRPAFSLRPSPVAPLPNEATFNRSSKARTLNANRDITQVSSGEARYYGADQPLLLEPFETNRLIDAKDPSNWDRSEPGLSVTINAGAAKGQPFSRVTLSGTGFDKFTNFLSVSGGDPVAVSLIGRRFSGSDKDIVLALFDGTGTQSISVNLQDGSFGLSEDASGTTIESKVIDIGGGWYYVKFVYEPTSTVDVNGLRLGLLGDGTEIDFLHAQAEKGYFVTTPISNNIGIRQPDKLEISVNDDNDEEGTFIFEFSIPAEKVSNNNAFLKFKGSGDKINIAHNGGGSPYFFKYSDSSSTTGIAATGLLSSFKKRKLAVSFDRNEIRISLAGNVNVNSQDYDGDIIGDDVKFRLFGIPLRLFSVRYFPQLLSTETLRTLTS